MKMNTISRSVRLHVDKIFEKAYESYDNPEYDEIESDFD